MTFTPSEIAFLSSQPLARLATVDSKGQPDVVPVAFEFDGTDFWVGGNGTEVLSTRKFRNITGGNRDVALVVDELTSLDPFVARGIRIYGHATDPVERNGAIGPGWYTHITPTVSWSWNMNGEPAGDAWYPTHRADHREATTKGRAVRE